MRYTCIDIFFFSSQNCPHPFMGEGRGPTHPSLGELYNFLKYRNWTMLQLFCQSKKPSKDDPPPPPFFFSPESYLRPGFYNNILNRHRHVHIDPKTMRASQSLRRGQGRLRKSMRRQVSAQASGPAVCRGRLGADIYMWIIVFIQSLWARGAERVLTLFALDDRLKQD